MKIARCTAVALLCVSSLTCSDKRESDTNTWVDPCGVTKAPTESRPARRTPVKQGRCLWLEHSDRERYLNICVNRILDEEAELVTEWHLYKRVEREGKSISPQRLNHPVRSCDRITRSDITVLVRDITPDQVTLERIWY